MFAKIQGIFIWLIWSKNERKSYCQQLRGCKHFKISSSLAIMYVISSYKPHSPLLPPLPNITASELLYVFARRPDLRDNRIARSLNISWQGAWNTWCTNRNLRQEKNSWQRNTLSTDVIRVNNDVIRYKSPSLWDLYRGADKSLARPTFRCVLFDGENISFEVSLILYTGCPRRNGQYSGKI